MTQPALADAAGLGLSSVVAFETARRPVAGATEAAIQAALEKAGVRFLAPGEIVDGSEGVRLA